MPLQRPPFHALPMNRWTMVLGPEPPFEAATSQPAEDRYGPPGRSPTRWHRPTQNGGLLAEFG